jgi:Spy/CpxP family protein refolding chaperone
MSHGHEWKRATIRANGAGANVDQSWSACPWSTQPTFIFNGDMMMNLRNRWGIGLGLGLAACVAVGAVKAQPPGRGDRDAGNGGVDTAVQRLMAFDANGDGNLSKNEVTDARLQPMLKRADANNDGVVSKEELTAQLTKEAGSLQRSERGGPPGDGPPPGDRGAGDRGPGDRGPGGRGPGGRGPGGPQPGQILPAFLQDELNLTEAQRTQLQDLQKDVDSRLAKILTSEQREQLQQMRNRGPGGPGGGPGGFGPPPDRGPRGEGNNPAGRPPRPQ